MIYIKLIAIKIGDFSSTIEFEQNYSPIELSICNDKRNELETKGLICIVANVNSDLRL